MLLDLRNTIPAEADRGPVLPRATTARVLGRPQPAANDQVALGRENRAVDPMLLVYQERMRTFHLLAQIFRRSMTSLLKRA